MIISIHGQRVFNKNGKCLDIDGGITYARKAQLWQCNGALHQTFQFVNDVIKIGGSSSNWCLNVDTNNNRPQAWRCNGDVVEGFAIKTTDDGSYVNIICTACHGRAGYCLNQPDYAANQNGGRTELAPCDGSDAQKFRFG